MIDKNAYFAFLQDLDLLFDFLVGRIWPMSAPKQVRVWIAISAIESNSIFNVSYFYRIIW